MRKSFSVFKTVGRKNLILSVVALLLVAILVTGSTLSWIENITALEIVSDNQDNSTPLKITSDLDNTVVMTESSNNAIDLGGYFYESGDMHLSACSSNGNLFYFNNLVNSSNEVEDKYRLGSVDDENTSYLSCTFIVSSPDETTDFWFDSIPTVSCTTNSTVNDNLQKYIRYSVTVDGKTTVFSNNGTSYNAVVDVAGKTSVVSPEKLSDFTHNSESASTNTDNNNVLFSVKKGTPKTVNIKIWLNYSASNITSWNGTDVKLEMIIGSSWAYNRTITFEDCTNDYDAVSLHWATIESKAKFYIKVGDYYKEMTGTGTTRSASIPAVYNDMDCEIIRCNQTYNAGDKLTPSGVSCWNYWSTTLPAGATDATFYALGSADNHGTWDEVEQIYLVDVGYIVGDNARAYVYDKSYTIKQVMCLTDEDKGLYTAYVREASKSIDFIVENSSCGYANREGYGHSEDGERGDNCYYVLNKIEDGQVKGKWSATGYSNASAFYIVGERFNGLGWDIASGAQMYYQDNSRLNGGSYVYTTIDATATGAYSFKVANANGNWYGSSSTISDRVNELSISTDSGSNIVLNANRVTGTFLFIYDCTNHKLTVEKIPTLPADGDKRVYVMLEADWGNWLTDMNHWNSSDESKVSDNYRDITWLQDDYSYNNYTFKLFLVDLDEDANRLHWHSEGNNTWLPSGGLSCTIENGYMYYLYSDSSGTNKSGTESGNTQAVGTLEASATSVSLGESITFTCSATNNGQAYKGKYVSYYVNDGSSTYIVGDKWLPPRAGTYTVTARANDGYICTDESNALTITVS